MKTCEFCKNSFKDRYLPKHKKTAKYCIELQKSHNITKNENINIIKNNTINTVDNGRENEDEDDRLQSKNDIENLNQKINKFTQTSFTYNNKLLEIENPTPEINTNSTPEIIVPNNELNAETNSINTSVEDNSFASVSEKQEHNYKEQIKYLQDKLENIKGVILFQENKPDYNEKLDNITRKLEFTEKALNAIAEFLLNTFT
jgi:hypothetical protein